MTLHCVCAVFSYSVRSDSFLTPWTVAHQAPLSMGFRRQEYWSGMPFSSPEDLPNPGTEPKSFKLVIITISYLCFACGLWLVYLSSFLICMVLQREYREIQI